MKLPRNVLVMTAASFLTDVSSDMVNNLIPLFLANALGARTGTIGLVEGVAESMSSFIKLLSGWWSDRVVSRKPPTVAGYTVSALSKPLLALAGSWSAVLAVRFGDRLGKGVRTAPRDALLADSVPAERRGAAFGFHRAGDSLGAVVGLGLALLVVWLMQGDALTLSRATFQRIALFSAVPALLAVVVLVVGLHEVRREAPAAGRPILGSLRAMPADYRRFLLIFGLFTLGNSADAFIILRAQERGLSVVGVLAMLLAFNVVYTAVAAKTQSLRSFSLSLCPLAPLRELLYTVMLRKFCRMRLPCSVRMLSGWNWTPTTGYSRCCKPITSPSRVKAVTASPSGSGSSTMSE